MLWRGSYEHPDGHIELDFEEPAGIDSRRDPFEVQRAKLRAHEERSDNPNSARVVWALWACFAAYRLGAHQGSWTWGEYCYAAAIIAAVWLIARR